MDTSKSLSDVRMATSTSGATGCTDTHRTSSMTPCVAMQYPAATSKQLMVWSAPAVTRMDPQGCADMLTTLPLWLPGFSRVNGLLACAAPPCYEQRDMALRLEVVCAVVSASAVYHCLCIVTCLARGFTRDCVS